MQVIAAVVAAPANAGDGRGDEGGVPTDACEARMRLVQVRHCYVGPTISGRV
jgi:hypothetical protein